jgi:general secretion pathway protein D
VVAACTVAAAGCTLPWQQLSLPGPIPPEAGPAPIATSSTKSGVPLSTPARDATAHERVYPGSGEFAGQPQPRPAPPDGGRDGVTLNLVEASIPEAAKSILGDTLGLNYAVSEKVKGSITLQTTRPIPKESLLEIFETLLRGEGASILVDQNLYRIVPASEASGNAPLRTRGARRLPGVSAQVVPLQYVAAAEMEGIIKSIAPNTTILRTDTVRNLLVVSGTRGEIDSILDAVSVFDVDWMRGMSFALLPVETSDPDAIAQELDTVFANDRDGPAKGVVRFVPNRRLKAILVISSRPEYLRKAETWMRRIDMVGRAAEKQVHVYHSQNRSAVELARLLQRVYASQEQARISVSTTPRPSLPPPDIGPIVSPPGPQPGGPVVVTPSPVVVTPSPVSPVTPEPPEPPDPGPGGDTQARPPTPPVGDDRTAGISIVADEANNALIITATPQEYRRMRQILERIDVAPNQVLLEATIAEVRLNDDLKFGVRWFFQTGNHQLRFTESEIGAQGPTFPGFSHFFNTPNVQFVLRALSTITDLNVISSPTLMVLDNKRATLQVGDEVPIATQSAVSVLTPGSPIVNSITYRNTGIVLHITPHISDKGRVLLEVEQEASDVVPTQSSTINSPTIQQRRVRTTVAVNDGEGIVLGGLIQDRASNRRDQVPLFGELPLFGNLFKNKVDEIARTELLIAITPRIVKDARHIRAITEEFRDKINFTTRPQRQAPPDRKEQLDRIVR